VKGYLVDTNIPSELTRERPDARVAAFLDNAGQSRVFLSVLTIGEICKGIATLPASQKRTGLEAWLDIEVRSWFAGRILPVTEAIAERWGYLAAAAKQKGMTLAVVDGIIAATALHHDLTIVTRNVKDFAGLDADVFNPFEAAGPAPKA
jgi:predicted nucleic acid-binding protein